jgi:F-type H+-transporting ATPase subunit b
MPQLSQLSDVALSQFLWLAIGLGFIFFVIARGMVPKIQATMDARDTKIGEDLKRAEAAHLEAEATEAAWRERMDVARANAARLTQEARQASARDTEKKVQAAAAKLNLKIESAEAKIRKAVGAAQSEIEAAAVDATQQLVTRLTGIKIDRAEAAKAVKAEFNV